MASIMRKMNIITRCEIMFRNHKLEDELQGIFHGYVLAICKNPGMTQQAIATHMRINKSNVARHLAFLEKEGYIRRTVGEEDKRESLVFPTEKMLELHPKVVELIKEWNALLSEEIPQEEMDVFHKVLDKIMDKAIEIIDTGMVEK